ncbi:hypothetical protein BJ875DRAFT_492298 [Amylocarpus encephaloides]|uniref:Uncharacterized protein n=1 Tax=Amylocarpus encephaloides TaxID=45428 RepID=A0A9P8C9C7_9HELO|nr:hypothetical protein BJ875DRAFT_492298 [Amylocarpus encephaloides]
MPSIEVDSFVWSVEPTLNSSSQEDFLRIKIPAADGRNNAPQDGLPPLEEWNTFDLRKLSSAYNERRLHLTLTPAPSEPNKYHENARDEPRNDVADDIEDEMLLGLSDSALYGSNTSIGRRTKKTLHRALKYQLIETIRSSAPHLAGFSKIKFSTQSRPQHPYYYKWVFTSEYPAFPDIYGGVSRWSVAQVEECRLALESGKLRVGSTMSVSEFSVDKSAGIVAELPTQSPNAVSKPVPLFSKPKKTSSLFFEDDYSNSKSERGPQLAECREPAPIVESPLSNVAVNTSIALSKDRHKAELGQLFEAATRLLSVQKELRSAEEKAKTVRAELQKERSDFEALDQLNGVAQQLIFQLETKEKTQERRIEEARLEGEAIGLRNQNAAIKAAHEKELAILRATHQEELKNAREESQQIGLIIGRTPLQTSPRMSLPVKSLSNVDGDGGSERSSSSSPNIINNKFITAGSEMHEDDITNNSATKISRTKQEDSLVGVEPTTSRTDQDDQDDQAIPPGSEPDSDSIESVDMDAKPQVRDPNAISRVLYEEALPYWLEASLTTHASRMDVFRRLSLAPSEEDQVSEGLRQRAQVSGAFETTYKNKRQMRQLKLRIAGWTSELAILYYLPPAPNAKSAIGMFTAIYQKFMFQYWNWKNERLGRQEELSKPSEAVQSRSVDAMLHRRSRSEETRPQYSGLSDLFDRQKPRRKLEDQEEEEELAMEDLYSTSPPPKSAGTAAKGIPSPIVKGHKRQAQVLTQHPQIAKLLNKKKFKKEMVGVLQPYETEDDEIVYSSKRHRRSQSMGGRKRRRR